MSSATIAPPNLVAAPDHRRRAFFVIVACTLLNAAAQVLIKSGANHMPHAGPLQALLGMLTNPALFFGYALYAVFCAAMIYALKHGELSILYPIISLGYVWVAILSVVIFHESMNVMKATGVVVIISGVGILGKGGSKF